MRKTTILVGTASLFLAVSIASFSRGTLPGINVTPSIARQTPSCGQCHGRVPGANNLQVQVVPSQRSLALGQTISIVTSATGGAPGNSGGFVMDTTAGKFSAGANSQITAAGNFITHTTSQTNRSWNLGYTAAQTVGLVELFTVVNTTNGNGNTTGDIWGFYHFDATQGQSTPVRLFVNAKGNQAFGSGCVGSFGNHPVLGSSEIPVTGNAQYGISVVGAAPSASVVILFGIKLPAPLSLSAIGVTGCDLLVQSFASLSGTTSAGNAQRGDGAATLAFPIPNMPSLAGLSLDTQAAIVDLSNGRPVPVTLTNGLTLTIQ